MKVSIQEDQADVLNFNTAHQVVIAIIMVKLLIFNMYLGLCANYPNGVPPCTDRL